MYTVYKKRVAWEVDKMKQETERQKNERDRKFEDTYLKKRQDEKSFIEEDLTVVEKTQAEKDREKEQEQKKEK